MRKDKLIIVLGVLIILAAAVKFFVYTTAGSKLVTDKIISQYIEHEGIDYKSLEGNLGSGLTFENLELKDIERLPEGTTLRIQKFFINVTSLGLDGVIVEFENVRLRLPNAEPIIISGTFREQKLDVNIYSEGFTLTELSAYLPDFKELIPLKGDIDNIDLYITGHYLEPYVKGTLVIEKFLYKGFLLTNAPLAVDMRLKDVKDNVKLYGTVNLEKADLKTNKVLINFEKGSLNFSGPFNQPQINLKGSSKVEETKINIGLKGTVEKPELTLSSEPAFSQEKLMVMLATGKSWKSVEDSLDNGLNSVALTKDFIDYFFFAGKSNQFAERYGISDFSVTYDGTTKGVSAKKDITQKLQVGYGIEQSINKEQITDVTQKLEAEYKVNKELSVGVEREMKKQQFNELVDEAIDENNNKVLLKYKKSF